MVPAPKEKQGVSMSNKNETEVHELTVDELHVAGADKNLIIEVGNVCVQKQITLWGFGSTVSYGCGLPPTIVRS